MGDRALPCDEAPPDGEFGAGVVEAGGVALGWGEVELCVVEGVADGDVLGAVLGAVVGAVWVDAGLVLVLPVVGAELLFPLADPPKNVVC